MNPKLSLWRLNQSQRDSMVEPGFGSMGQSEPSAGEMDLDEVEQEVGPGVSIQNNSQPQTQKMIMVN